ncbi:hypothetical protein HJG60_010968 [Phyllostomus discolor]|uniref:CSD domain-containing protein n=1 Tax=Phyllostomus discolor TaxID=89673 RepID=A0A834E6M4_9CHIR|nr:hypothetical protein HJG60_010968 [Phyllostomus discolor]
MNGQEVFYLIYTPEDVEGNVQLETGDKINFVIDNSKHTGAISAQNIMLVKKKQARCQEVICAMKEAFGFIERDISIEHFEGTVTKVIPKVPSKNQNDPLPGCIEVDFMIPEELTIGDKDTKSKVLLEGHNSNSKRLLGYVATRKDNFGFMETASHDEEIFFYYRELSGDIESLELGDKVEYSLSKGEDNKVSAEKVNKTHSVNGITKEADPTDLLG